MPEGHSIHRIARDMGRWFEGQNLAASSPQGRFLEGARSIDGDRLDRSDAHGKHLLLWFGESALHIHLGLYGRTKGFKLPSPEPRGAIRLRLEGKKRGWDLRGPTACEILDSCGVNALKKRLGPDPLRTDSTWEDLARSLSRRRQRIATALLDQSIVSGLGNIYRAELLHELRLHPDLPANQLSASQVERLWTTSVRWMKEGVRLNRIVTPSLEDEGQAFRKMDPYSRLRVFRREECRTCGGAVEAVQLGQRRLYWCPSCQSGK
jgi:endonuclease VIII